jgi:transcriptional regulator with XRE-family HTH domain
VTSFQKNSAAFGERLRQLRGELSAKALADRVGWPPPKLSKVENGKQLLSPEELEDLLEILEPPERTVLVLRADLYDLYEQRVVWRQQVRAGYKARQEEAQDIEARATHIRGVDFGLVPGLLQTAEYARQVLLAARALHGGKDDIEETVRARMVRQSVLYEPGKSIELLFSESALWHPVAAPEVMLGQVRRLQAAIGTPGLRLGILPVGKRLPVPPIQSFWIFDNVVLTEDLISERVVSDPGEVATYALACDELWGVAVEGKELRSILDESARKVSAR